MAVRMEASSSETRDASDLQASESRAHEMYIEYTYLFCCLCHYNSYLSFRNSHFKKLHEVMAGAFANPFFAIPTEEAQLCLTGARDMMQPSGNQLNCT